MELMVCHSDHEFRLQRLLLVMCHFSEYERWGISDCEWIYLCPCFKESEKDQGSVSPHEIPSLIGNLTQPQLVEWLRGRKGLLLRWWLGDG